MRKDGTRKKVSVGDLVERKRHFRKGPVQPTQPVFPGVPRLQAGLKIGCGCLFETEESICGTFCKELVKQKRSWGKEARRVLLHRRDPKKGTTCEKKRRTSHTYISRRWRQENS